MSITGHGGLAYISLFLGAQGDTLSRPIPYRAYDDGDEPTPLELLAAKNLALWDRPN